MKLSDFYYELSPDRVAQEPITPRDRSKLMVLDRKNREFQHRHFYEITEFLRAGDVLVTNATKVFPARMRGRKETGGKVEVLLVTPQKTFWKSLVRGATKASKLIFPEGLEAQMVERTNDGEWLLTFSSNHLREYLDRHGEMPLPPYIKRPESRDSDLERYQTVYAQKEGAVAAPTAGFHFTPELLTAIRDKGVTVQSIVLHVGWGTFRPVRTETIEKHAMLPESYEVTESAARELNAARNENRRIIAVGTTAVRTLETVFDAKGLFHSGKGQADLFIYPGYHFKAVDALITNFHLPDSTPLLLACAFYAHPHPPTPPSNLCARSRLGHRSRDASDRWSPLSMEKGRNPSPYLMERASVSRVRVNTPFSLRFAYEEAIRQEYRFYSYGDAMFIQ